MVPSRGVWSGKEDKVRREESVGELDRKKNQSIGGHKEVETPPPHLLLYRLWNRG